MGLESATYVSGLTPAWPEAGDRKSQGDDHIRLLKTVLQTTFPGADKPFYFPSAVGKTSGYTILAADENKLIYFDTTAGNILATLPSLSASVTGWAIRMMLTGGANGLRVQAAAGNIYSRVGSVATVRIGVIAETVEFIWTGATWICSKSGPLIGTSEEFWGASLPSGYLWANGGSFSSSDYAELAAVLGSTTLPDLRGRVVAGKDNMGGGSADRLLGSWGGPNGDILGAAGGGENHALVTANLPPYTPTGSVIITDPGHGHNITSANFGSGGFSANSALGGSLSSNVQGNTTGITASFSGNAQGGVSQAFGLVQPTIIANKIIRAC